MKSRTIAKQEFAHLMRVLLAVCVSGGLWLAGCSSGEAPPPVLEPEGAPADQNIGERLFVETRFAEYFAANMTDINAPLSVGDPVVSQVQNVYTGPMPGPFAGQSINCRSCHFVVEFQGVPGAGNRTYSDFTTRSPLPLAMNGFTTTPRNSMQMVGSLQPRSVPTFLHFDGQFSDPADLVEETLTGRNFGWGPTQYQQAIAHIADVIRNDNGMNTPASEYGCNFSYRAIFLGTNASIPAICRLPSQYLMDVTTASNQQIVDNISQLIAQYMRGLLFKQDENGNYYASPYDVFLRINHLPTQPTGGQSPQQYSQHLYQALLSLSNPTWVDGTYGKFQYHAQPFAFGTTELAGLEIFLKASAAATDGSQHAGNCASCHVAPNFSDFGFHNTGVSQEEYDAANGQGAFMALVVPSLALRSQSYDAYLPVTQAHPNATESFRHPAVAGSPQFADLGLWNVYLNPDIPKPQTSLTSVVCANSLNCTVDQGLPSTVAQFKTPTLRDLEDSAPYFHNGSKLTFNDVILFYINNSQLARQGLLRNPPPEFQNMSISQADMAALVAFLKSLTEDYDDA
jgi:cytochrome c peroxidase